MSIFDPTRPPEIAEFGFHDRCGEDGYEYHGTWALGEFLRSIGVLPTLIQLAIQIRQNTYSLDENRRLALVDSFVRRNDLIERSIMQTAASEVLTAILTRSQEHHQLTRALGAIGTAFVGICSSITVGKPVFFQYQQGLLDDEYYDYQFKPLVSFAAPRWKQLGLGIQRPSFRLAVDEVLKGTPDPE